MYFLIFLALSTSAMSGCSTLNLPTLKMLSSRADYDGKGKTKEDLSQLKSPLISPYRTETKTTDIYIHPHELPNGDYFLGGRVRVITEQSRWETSETLVVEPTKKKKAKNTRKGVDR